MTLTFQDLVDFRRQEMDNPVMIRPAKNFLQDLKDYMIRVQQEAGPQPVTWDPDCEALAAIAVLEEIFLLRKEKLSICARDNAPPTPDQMFDLEMDAWYGLRRVYETLEKKTRQTIVGMGATR